MSFHLHVAETAIRKGDTPQLYRTAAQTNATAFWLFAVVGAGVWYFVGLGWSLIPFLIAVFFAVFSVGSLFTARDLEHRALSGKTPPESLDLPAQIDLDDVQQVMLIEEIRLQYAALLMDKTHPYAACVFRPASLLPFPKATIKLALQAQLDFSEGQRDSQLLDASTRTPEMVDLLQWGITNLDNYLEVPPQSLPTDPLQNSSVGFCLSKQ